MELNVTNEEIIYPSIIFKLKDDYYSVSSKYVQTIMQKPSYKKIPNSNPMIDGVFMFRDGTVPLLNLRVAFGMTTIQQEIDEFEAMIDARKEDHIKWVDELRRCLTSNEKFTLATDPHKCAFGRWMDEHKSEHNMLMTNINQISTPHTKLHEAAVKAEDLRLNGNYDELRNLMKKIDNDYMNKIMTILENIKEVHKDSYREMTLVLSGNNTIGIVVDEVIAVEVLKDVSGNETIKRLNDTKYIVGVKKSEKIDEIIMGLDTERLLNIADEFNEAHGDIL